MVPVAAVHDKSAAVLDAGRDGQMGRSGNGSHHADRQDVDVRVVGQRDAGDGLGAVDGQRVAVDVERAGGPTAVGGVAIGGRQRDRLARIALWRGPIAQALR